MEKGPRGAFQGAARYGREVAIRRVKSSIWETFFYGLTLQPIWRRQTTSKPPSSAAGDRRTCWPSLCLYLDDGTGSTDEYGPAPVYPGLPLRRLDTALLIENTYAVGLHNWTRAAAGHEQLYYRPRCI